MMASGLFSAASVSPDSALMAVLTAKPSIRSIWANVCVTASSSSTMRIEGVWFPVAADICVIVADRNVRESQWVPEELDNSVLHFGVSYRQYPISWRR